ncbi:transposable element Tcb1 transposase [Trichonephila clavipes]|nr:transposable element Tcb1 transposase [Trichonephila clavipes]
MLNRQLGRSDCVVSRCWDQWIQEMSFTPRPAQDALDRPVFEKTATSGPCVFSNHTNAPCRRIFGITTPITCAALDAYVWSGAAQEETGLQRNGTSAVYSDESRFNLSSDDNRVRVGRPCGERLNPAFASQRHTALSAGVLV